MWTRHGPCPVQPPRRRPPRHLPAPARSSGNVINSISSLAGGHGVLQLQRDEVAESSRAASWPGAGPCHVRHGFPCPALRSQAAAATLPG